jgi:hypothetical protein
MIKSAQSSRLMRQLLLQLCERLSESFRVDVETTENFSGLVAPAASLDGHCSCIGDHHQWWHQRLHKPWQPHEVITSLDSVLLG